MKKVYGNTTGLKTDQIRRIENLGRRRVPEGVLISRELARDIAGLSREINRQIGLLIDRAGRVVTVIVGDADRILIPDTPDYKTTPGRLKNLRCVHTHPGGEGLTRDDLTDLSLLRLDMMAAITLRPGGLPKEIHAAHILPVAQNAKSLEILPPVPYDRMDADIDFGGIVRVLEDELNRLISLHRSGKGKEKALLVSVSTSPVRAAKESMAELVELAVSCGIDVAETIIQQRKKADPRYLLGKGKLQELTIAALEKGASLIIFDQDLNPTQIRTITSQTELKVIDRTQLILDIFAQRAQSREGKLQVELAQLKYMLPRLVGKNTAMSRLAGGIGGRGPGETKLEIDRRRVRERISRLKKNIASVRKNRAVQKARRDREKLPVISIIGYTNAGKSTLLNTLTDSRVLAESRLFATLDPTSRRLRFPKDRDVIITDTVGFIRNLPKDLMEAFHATLEELERADLLLHVIDMSNPNMENHILAVEEVLRNLGLEDIPEIRVLNKADLVDPDTQEQLQSRWKGICVSATNSASLAPLLGLMNEKITAIREEKGLSAA